MKTLDLLLNLDQSKLKSQTKSFKVKRLSDLVKGDVIFDLKGISLDKYADIGETSSGHMDVKIFTVIEGVAEPSFKNKNLMEKYECITPKELVNKMLNPGEVSIIYEEIAKLSGFGRDIVEEVKN